jgi:hypothetical protein
MHKMFIGNSESFNSIKFNQSNLQLQRQRCSRPERFKARTNNFYSKTRYAIRCVVNFYNAGVVARDRRMGSRLSHLAACSFTQINVYQIHTYVCHTFTNYIRFPHEQQIVNFGLCIWTHACVHRSNLSADRTICSVRTQELCSFNVRFSLEF